MKEILKKFGVKKLGGLVLIVIIIIAFGFGGFGGGFSTNNQNNIAKINKTNVTTQDFMNYLNQSGISQQAIRENLDNNIIEELLSGLISTTLIDLEVEDFNLSITELTVLKKIKENKNFHDENDVFQRTKYEKFLLSNNMSAPMFELQLKNRELQKHLFDFIGAGTITPDFLTKKKFEDENKSLNLEYFAMENLYKKKENFTDNEINKFLDQNKDQLKKNILILNMLSLILKF
jgi:peptidyl-prolyl cis-trans isomerase D